MATTATFSAAMKTKFIGPIRNQLHSNKILLEGTRSLDSTDEPGPQAGQRDFAGIKSDATGIDFVGNEFRIPLRTSRNQGVGSRTENAVLPAPGNEGFQYISDPLRYYYGLFNITGQLMKASESNEGAFKRAMTVEMDGVTDALKRRVNQHAYGDGTGDLTLCRTAVGPTTTLTVDSTINFQVGEVVDVYDISGTAYLANARTVTAVDRANRTITIDGANISTEVGDRIIGASSDSTSGTPNNDKDFALNGLENIVSSTGALHGLNPVTAGQQFWASSQRDASSAVVGDDLLRKICDDVGFETGADSQKLFITTRGIRNRYANTLTALKRFNDAQAVTLRGGYKALLFDDMPMVIDDQCPIQTVYALNTDALFWSEMSDWEWLDEDGEILKWDSRYDRYVAVLFKYCNLGTWARNRHGKIINAADDIR